MRIITGSQRGRKLRSLDGMDVRPTSEKVKEAIFSAIQFDLDNATVCDLFCGTGQLGLEALSRGAKYCRFVDKSPQSVDVTKENIVATGFSDDAGVTLMDSVEFIRNARLTFDIVIIDPPYEKGLVLDVLPYVATKLSNTGIVVCEHEAWLELPEACGNAKKHKTYKYGKVGVTIYRTPIEEEEDI